MSDVILGPYFGGLGDSLQFSTLPEEFHKQKGRETYISEGTTFRNREIYDLVWGANPYVKGVKAGRNAGDLAEFNPVINHTGNWISNWEYLHGLEPTNTRPKIYYEPKTIEGLEDVILVDRSCITINLENTGYGYDVEQVEKTYRTIRRMYPEKRFLVTNFKGDIGEVNRYVPDADEEIEVESIFHYCDLMYSSHGICCFYSGSMVLATAVQRYKEDLNILCITSPSVYNSGRTQMMCIFHFPDHVNYIITE